MKKILILANNDVGLYKFRKELIQQLLKHNEVYISLPDGELVKPLIEMGCKFIDTSVDRRGVNPITDMKLIKEYKRILKQVNPDQVITYTIKPNIYGSIVSRMKKVDYAVNITGLGTAFQKEGILKKIIVAMYKVALKKAKIVFFENVENRNVFIDEGIVSLDKTRVLNGAGVNLNEYPFIEYPTQDKNIKFLFIGRIMKEKGINEFLNAAHRIKKEYTNVEFDVVGPMEDDYKDIIENDNVISYHGFQSDVQPFIKQCHCFVLPSYHEGMANTLLESASMGRPLITSNIHGCKEAVKDNGYLVNVKDSEDLYKAMREFINLDYSKKVEMAKKSRELMEEVFDKKKVVEETMKGLGLNG